MPPERRRLIVLLTILGAVVLVAVYRFWPSAPDAAAARAAARPAARPTAAATLSAPDVHLQALQGERPRPVEEPGRDLFRFMSKAPPPRVVAAPAQSAGPAGQAPPGPPPPPTVAPITMRFIGVLEATEHAQKIAVLTDGRGIYQGREGDIIEGRYRIIHIGVESVEMAYLDGRGRQTIRLSGS
ncbi:MAG: hypothetical protein AB7H96_06360 [Vicinamibacterales bacterium]